MINRIKGTRDYSSRELQYRQDIINEFLQSCDLYGFNLIETPIFENASLFRRSVGGSDIVHKEMYEFKDKGGRDIALRPEGTAGFVRAMIENKWYAPSDSDYAKVTKYAYYGPMFRYEQPQKGRLRQFYQAGVESICPKTDLPNEFQDAELIILANSILSNLDIDYQLKINSIGDKESRERYQIVLKKYFEKYKDQLSEINQERLQNNVLRILDDKEDSQKSFVKKAPKIKDYLTDNSKNYFAKLLKILDDNGIEYKIDDSLVRGLDYYDEVVYEFVSDDESAGSQATIIGGGRYSTLVKELDGPDLYSSGWGMGLDRIIDIYFSDLDDYADGEDDDLPLSQSIDILVATSNSNRRNDFFNLVSQLRDKNLSVEFLFEAVKQKKIFDKAKKFKCRFLITDDEKEPNNLAVIKNLETNEKIHFNEKTYTGFETVLEFINSYLLEYDDTDETDEEEDF
ncbi:histidine--tRNA ligase [Mycoplasmopsis primatum]|uniref:histidine--tRNA ligase n=1 Tax=Mycoplasmopsis primatum TaxID=55604 RepID=UPI000497FC2F|nr:histidine--tRNA ligase [Mycoplasmopsis primatum]